MRGFLLLAFSIVAAGCDDAAQKAAARATSRERSEVVAATGPLAPTTKVSNSTASAVPPAAPPSPRKLCEGQLAKPGRDLPKKPLSHKSVSGQRPVGPAFPGGKWAWVNLWAAWCAPCKEEMPRVRAFASRLEQAGKDINLVFVSLDDDERQLEEFLSGAATDTLRSTYWLREGRERDDWLAGVGLGKSPDLPVQLLIDPRGKLRCTVHGAVEEGDYAEIAAAVSSP